ncbi:MAG: hypothetical protein O3B73_10835 [bacterium]|nr:hypothetical protein [bacterium]
MSTQSHLLYVASSFVERANQIQPYFDGELICVDDAQSAIEVLREKAHSFLAAVIDGLSIGGASSERVEVSPAPPADEDIVSAFYFQIGSPELSDGQRARDRTAYEDMRRTGYSDAQIQQTALWANQNVRGVKAFALVKHCIHEAMKERDK